jgi:hypothetical protein
VPATFHVVARVEVTDAAVFHAVAFVWVTLARVVHVVARVAATEARTVHEVGACGVDRSLGGPRRRAGPLLDPQVS